MANIYLTIHKQNINMKNWQQKKFAFGSFLINWLTLLPLSNICLSIPTLFKALNCPDFRLAINYQFTALGSTASGTIQMSLT